MRIAFLGTSEFVGSIQHARFLRRLIAAGVRPAVVVTAPDAPSEPRMLAVKSAALEFGLPVLQPSTLNGFSQELARREIELSLVVAYGKILPPDVLAVPKFGSLNIHPSLLPRWRGTSPIQTTILAGDAVTGVTIIQMDAEMDHGPIVARREFPLGGRVWTAPELSDSLADLGVELFLEILEPWTAGKITPQPQDHEAATFSRILKKEDGRIDWTKPDAEIEPMTRAFQPWPGVYTFWHRSENQLRLAVEEASIGNLEFVILPKAQGLGPIGNLEVGTVFKFNREIGVRCGKGALILQRLKLEGGRAMDGTAFLRGHPDIIGATLR